MSQYSGSQHSQFHELFSYLNDEEECVSRSKGTLNFLKLSLKMDTIWILENLEIYLEQLRYANLLLNCKFYEN